MASGILHALLNTILQPTLAKNTSLTLSYCYSKAATLLNMKSFVF